MVITEEKIGISKKREYLVVKGNDLIQKNRFDLSLQEQKTIAFICSMIKPNTSVNAVDGVSYQLEYEFNIRDYCKVCGMDYDNGKNYADIKNVLKHLRDRSMWLTLEDGSETTVAWLSKVTTNKKSGIAKICLDADLAPYLFNLGQCFTQYQLYNILAMRSAFSVRIYELMKSYAFQSSKTFDLDELKRLLSVDTIKSYSRFPDFRRKVLERAQDEINKMTDLKIYFEPITRGKKVVKIRFKIIRKKSIDATLDNMRYMEKLDKKREKVSI